MFPISLTQAHSTREHRLLFVQPGPEAKPAPEVEQQQKKDLEQKLQDFEGLLNAEHPEAAQEVAKHKVAGANEAVAQFRERANGALEKAATLHFDVLVLRATEPNDALAQVNTLFAPVAQFDLVAMLPDGTGQLNMRAAPPPAPAAPGAAPEAPHPFDGLDMFLEKGMTEEQRRQLEAASAGIPDRTKHILYKAYNEHVKTPEDIQMMVNNTKRLSEVPADQRFALFMNGAQMLRNRNVESKNEKLSPELRKFLNDTPEQEAQLMLKIEASLREAFAAQEASDQMVLPEDQKKTIVKNANMMLEKFDYDKASSVEREMMLGKLQMTGIDVTDEEGTLRDRTLVAYEGTGPGDRSLNKFIGFIRFAIAIVDKLGGKDRKEKKEAKESQEEETEGLKTRVSALNAHPLNKAAVFELQTEEKKNEKGETVYKEGVALVEHTLVMRPVPGAEVSADDFKAFVAIISTIPGFSLEPLKGQAIIKGADGNAIGIIEKAFQTKEAEVQAKTAEEVNTLITGIKSHPAYLKLPPTDATKNRVDGMIAALADKVSKGAKPEEIKALIEDLKKEKEGIEKGAELVETKGNAETVYKRVSETLKKEVARISAASKAEADAALANLDTIRKDGAVADIKGAIATVVAVETKINGELKKLDEELMKTKEEAKALIEKARGMRTQTGITDAIRKELDQKIQTLESKKDGNDTSAVRGAIQDLDLYVKEMPVKIEKARKEEQEKADRVRREEVERARNARFANGKAYLEGFCKLKDGDYFYDADGNADFVLHWDGNQWQWREEDSGLEPTGKRYVKGWGGSKSGEIQINGVLERLDQINLA